MQNIKTLFEYCIAILDTELTFAPYTFSILDVMLGVGVLSIIIFFIIKIFE